MSASEKLGRALVKQLGPGLLRSRRILYNPDFKHFINGFLIERTAYKATYVLRLLIALLYDVRDFLPLTYSTSLINITAEHRSSLFCGKTVDLLEQMLESIKVEHLDELVMRSPQYDATTFLSKFDIGDPYKVPFVRVYSFSVAFALAGQPERALEYARICLEGAEKTIAMSPDPKRVDWLLWLADRTRALLGIRDGDYETLVSTWSEEGARFLRLERAS